MLGYYNYTVIPTYAGAVASIVGIFLAATGHPAGAIFCLLFAGLTDMFDGKIARTKQRTEEECRFGIQIDSLCDLISFGVLPAAIGWSVGMTHPAAWIVLVGFILAALIRLAYFNVTEETRQATETGQRTAYTGLPVTSVALIFPFLYGLRGWLTDAFPYIYGVMMVLIAVAFISPFSLAKPGTRGQLLMLVLGVAEVVLLIVTHL